MLIIGLTGSIGMGKSTAAARFRSHGIAVCDADQLVHDLYQSTAVPLIDKAFPGVSVIDTAGQRVVDRQKLGAVLLADPSGFETLERIIHPLVRAAEQAYLQDAYARGELLVVLEIPLLFETGGDELVDVVVVVSSTADLQTSRVLKRPGMSLEKLDAIRARQMPDPEKRARADYVIDTSGPVEQGWAQIDALIPKLKERRGQAYETHWATKAPG